MTGDFKKYVVMGAGLAVGLALASMVLGVVGKGLKL